MHILVVGDTHGRNDWMNKGIKALPKIDLILHTGDHFRDGHVLANKMKSQCISVAGNCDPRNHEVTERTLEIDGHRIFLTPGHLFNMKRSMNNLYFKAQQSRIDIVIFGHTHVSYLEKTENIWFLNPGSPSVPRAGRSKTYGLIQLKPDQSKLKILEIT
ncbi:MAG: metallophosphoesterase [Syntrophomonadaceae bacterium]|nr:metallophosphoesterase [Syntrophomonadaceae bacterium]